MGKSSCLKMIACGSNTAAADDDVVDHRTLTTTTNTAAAFQTKPSVDKRGWSFRNKAARHLLLPNTLTSQSPAATDKDSPLLVTTDFQAPLKATSAHDCPQLPEPADKPAFEYYTESKTSVGLIASQNDCPVACDKPKVSQLLLDSDDDPNSTAADDTVLVLEHHVFEPPPDLGILAESVVSKAEADPMTESQTLDSARVSEDVTDAPVVVDDHVAIIVQASIRGFLAQQGFMQLKNVVMLQSVIRGHLVRRNAVETFHCLRGIAKVQALVRAQSSKTTDQNYIKCERQFSTAKLLKNSFARQLLESTPKPKTMNIRCDPLSPNSAWGWLERWMSAASEVWEKTDPIEEMLSGCQVEPSVELLSTSVPGSFVSEVIVNEMTTSFQNEGNHANHVDSQSSLSIFAEEQEPDQQMAVDTNENVNSIETAALESVVSVSQVYPLSLADDDAAEIHQPKLSSKRSASEYLNGEGKKLSCRSRNVPTSAVLIAQTKFDGLTSVADPTSSSHQVGADNPADTSSYLEETISKISNPSAVGVDVPPDQRIVVAGSECGTELSVTSTLDSPDRCHIEDVQPEPEFKILETSIDLDESEKGQDRETNGTSSNPISDLPSEITSVTPYVEKVAPLAEQITKSEMEAPNELQGIDADVMAIKEEVNEEEKRFENVTVLLTEKLSLEASPRSHMTVPESQGTPSSQVSVKGKRNRIGKSGSEKKRNSLSVGKKSPSNTNLDSGARSSAEHLPKDHKNGKRNSFGSTKSDFDQEPRDSNSYSSVPSYMQATKSAKAKAHSPRSSPDLHDKEVNSKKRQSLPGAGGRQGSPRVQRSASEAAKPNGSCPPNERKWQR